jgi:drug/metabolite transporter (DMT)-like permease
MYRITAAPGILFAMGSAILFALSTPLAKLLLREGVSPQLLAGLFYLGSGLGLGLFKLGLAGVANEAPLRAQDLPRFAMAVLLGGAVAPALLLLGLSKTPASTAALLLNLEGIATMAIAWLIFHENVDRRLMLGAIAIFAGAIVLSWTGGGVVPGGGSLLIGAACVAWGVDNNLTRTLSNADPVQIALIKGLVAGGANFALALLTGAHLPSFAIVTYALALGFFGYGISVVLFVRALRLLGAARTSAYFSTAPFVGALLAIALYSEAVSARLVIAGLLMAAGVYIHLRESHEHRHVHEFMEHEHSHVHDAHHQHEHGSTNAGTEPHSHWHRHVPLVHSHPHYPDMHHRHDHSHPSR